MEGAAFAPSAAEPIFNRYLEPVPYPSVAVPAALSVSYAPARQEMVREVAVRSGA